ncbi:lysine N(6)-hydroxylase/L-ornithine N(5)-oxygenase family protein [Antrihabitans cavernicola]|uniref:L-lysine N6-monooxygenase MbtG n=2 Tax=Antrihabitans cavernicola TaxID=2495913 RepID=A0A5A7S6U6_9NOCA|nr:lysine N(6)-hydroxylase/L-ornithine N(5)-oxygenase family protein [Spelaeibacter cavernicola]
MRELGLDAPRVVVVESHAVGANWLGIGGWTDGSHRLGTSPEKDIGFPYRSSVVRGHNHRINEKMLGFSWISFLIEHGNYAEWIDRGRPNPQHHRWAGYLQWVAHKIELDLVIGTATAATLDGDRWDVTVESADGTTTQLDADGLMITGPGASGSALSRHPRILSIAEFWDLAGRRELPTALQAAVIGGGETAGSALNELARHDAMTISVISPTATLYSRGESYFENAMFSDPAKWSALSVDQRRDVIRRTDRGVFSIRVLDSLLGDDRIYHLQGRVTGAHSRGDLVELTLHNDSQLEQTHAFDLVVDATGGQPLWFLDLLTPDAVDALELAVGWPTSQEQIESSIGYDLAVQGLTPKLFLPNLAGVAQGPGFPNLSSLGLLSDRVLRSPRLRAASAASADQRHHFVQRGTAENRGDR